MMLPSISVRDHHSNIFNLDIEKSCHMVNHSCLNSPFPEIRVKIACIHELTRDNCEYLGCVFLKPPIQRQTKCDSQHGQLPLFFGVEHMWYFIQKKVKTIIYSILFFPPTSPRLHWKMVHPRKLTCQWKNNRLKMYLLLKTGDFPLSCSYFSGEYIQLSIPILSK